MSEGNTSAIIFGVVFLLVSFFGLWIWFARKEELIKKYIQNLSAFHQKLQAHQFYLSGLFKRFHLKSLPSWAFSLPLLIGALVFIISSWIFGLIAEDIISREPLTVVDTEINEWFFYRTSLPLTNFMLIISAFASFNTMIILYLFLVLILTRQKSWYDLTFLSLSIPGGMLLIHLMKLAFHRPRPSLYLFYSSSLDYSFPSGHTMNATILYGTIVILVLHRIKKWKWKVFTVLLAILGILLVSLSRVYLGYHYFSDTLAAAAIGLAWLSLCFIATLALKHTGHKV